MLKNVSAARYHCNVHTIRCFKNPTSMVGHDCAHAGSLTPSFTWDVKKVGLFHFVISPASSCLDQGCIIDLGNAVVIPVLCRKNIYYSPSCVIANILPGRWHIRSRTRSSTQCPVLCGFQVRPWSITSSYVECCGIYCNRSCTTSRNIKFSCFDKLPIVMIVGIAIIQDRVTFISTPTDHRDITI